MNKDGLPIEANVDRIKINHDEIWIKNIIKALRKLEEQQPGFIHGYVKNLKDHVAKERMTEKEAQRLISKLKLGVKLR